jgi:hypothetical protein
MSAGERDERVELERAESPRAREAWRAFELVQQTMDIGGADAPRLTLALIASPGGTRVGWRWARDRLRTSSMITVPPLSTWSSRRHGSPRNSHRLSEVAVEQEPSLRSPQID